MLWWICLCAGHQVEPPPKNCVWDAQCLPSQKRHPGHWRPDKTSHDSWGYCGASDPAHIEVHFGAGVLALSLQPRLHLCQRQKPMRKPILLRLIHLRISLAINFKDRIPAFALSVNHLLALGTLTRHANIPKVAGPLAGTILPCKILAVLSLGRRRWISLLTKTLPSKSTGSCPGPSQYANVHTA